MHPAELFVTFVLDRSGSMELIKNDTMGGFNSYVDGLKRDKPCTEFTLILFGGNDVEVRHRAVPISTVPPLTAAAYVPNGGTPLIDACYKAILATKERAPAGSHVVVVIQTDGEENESHQYTQAQLAQLVKDQTAAGWLFLFLGAGIDAFKTAGNFGISGAHTMSYTGVNTRSTFAAARGQTITYSVVPDSVAGAAQAAFTEDERAEAVKPKPVADPFKI